GESRITTGSIVHPDGSVSGQWSTPYATRTLNEGHDDDWGYDAREFATHPDGSMVMSGKGDDAQPVNVEVGDEVFASDGTKVTVATDPHVKTEHLDDADYFQQFMDGPGQWVVAGGAMVLGIAAMATGVGAPLGVALMVGAGALAGVQLTKTIMDYNEGEAELWQVGLDALGVVGAAGLATRMAGQVARAGSAAAGAGNALRGSQLVTALDSTVGRAALTGSQVLDNGGAVWGAGMAVNQGLQTGDWGSAMLLLGASVLGVGAGTITARAAARSAARGAEGAPASVEVPVARVDAAVATGGGVDAAAIVALPPNRRHFLDELGSSTGGNVRKSNTVIDGSADVDADMAAIIAGNATHNSSGQWVTPSGRVYAGHTQTGGVASQRMIPVSGPGVHELDRGQFMALQTIAKAGGVDAARTDLDAARPPFRDDQVARASEVWEANARAGSARTTTGSASATSNTSDHVVGYGDASSVEASQVSSASLSGDPRFPMRFEDDRSMIDHDADATARGPAPARPVTGFRAEITLYSPSGAIVGTARTGRPVPLSRGAATVSRDLETAPAAWGARDRLDEAFRANGSQFAAAHAVQGQYSLPERPVVDLQTYFGRSLDYRDMATGQRPFEPGIVAVRDVGGSMTLTNSVTREVAVVEPNSTIRSLTVAAPGQPSIAWNMDVNRQYQRIGWGVHVRDQARSSPADFVRAYMQAQQVGNGVGPYVTEHFGDRLQRRVKAMGPEYALEDGSLLQTRTRDDGSTFTIDTRGGTVALDPFPRVEYPHDFSSMDQLSGQDVALNYPEELVGSPVANPHAVGSSSDDWRVDGMAYARDGRVMYALGYTGSGPLEQITVAGNHHVANLAQSSSADRPFSVLVPVEEVVATQRAGWSADTTSVDSLRVWNLEQLNSSPRLPNSVLTNTPLSWNVDGVKVDGLRIDPSPNPSKPFAQQVFLVDGDGQRVTNARGQTLMPLLTDVVRTNPATFGPLIEGTPAPGARMVSNGVDVRFVAPTPSADQAAAIVTTKLAQVRSVYSEVFGPEFAARIFGARTITVLDPRRAGNATNRSGKGETLFGTGNSRMAPAHLSIETIAHELGHEVQRQVVPLTTVNNTSEAGAISEFIGDHLARALSPGSGFGRDWATQGTLRDTSAYLADGTLNETGINTYGAYRAREAELRATNPTAVVEVHEGSVFLSRIVDDIARHGGEAMLDRVLYPALTDPALAARLDMPTLAAAWRTQAQRVGSDAYDIVDRALVTRGL
ncbi:MAG: hypothetical protein H7287_11030, partial [Thermoleophilia bacterium]|nr:hypothetical protein [Thermoleophilia bacterium]